MTPTQREIYDAAAAMLRTRRTIGPAELARATHRSRSTVHDHLKALTSQQRLARIPTGHTGKKGRYTLSQ
jgi:DNA-binding IclR family transcriptional regulator